MSQIPLLREGEVLHSRYRIVRLVGRGGMGAVYQALDTRLHHTVALKQTLLQSLQLTEAFAQEARLLAALRHPALPVVSDYFAADSGQFLVMQFIPGDDLSAVLAKRSAPFPVPIVTEWAERLLDALDYLHGQNPPVLHRDIKPQNLKLTPEGDIVLLDFGLAKRSHAASADAPPPLSVHGYTRQYAPPEQANHEGTTPRSDLYSCAASLYELLSRVPPPAAGLRATAIATGAPDPLPPLLKLNPKVPPHFADAIHQALALAMDERPYSAAALRDLLLSPYQSTVVRTAPAVRHAPPPSPAGSKEATSLSSAPRPVDYDVDERRSAFRQLLENFVEEIHRESLRSILGREAVAHLRQRERRISVRLETPFTLVVIGDFKRGKSVLVNALLGQEVVTSDVTPETITINRVTYGPTRTIYAHLRDGGRIPIELDELRAEHLAPLLKRLPQPVDHLTITASVEWLRNLVLVDMPGTGDAGWRFDRQVQAYLAEADAVLYVVSALAQLSLSEQAFLRLAVLPQEFPKIVFVANMLDKIRQADDTPRVMQLIQDRIDTLYPGAAVFGVSALDELHRQLHRPRPNLAQATTLAAAFADLRTYLDDNILLNRDVIQIDRALMQLRALGDTVETMLMGVQTGMERDQTQLHAAIVQCEDQTSSLHRTLAAQRTRIQNRLAALERQSQTWLNEFFDRLDAEVARRLNQYRLGDLRRHFHFFCSDVITTALSACLQAHEPAIAALLAETEAALRTSLELHTDPIRSQPAALGIAVASATFKDAEGLSGLETLQWLTSFAPTSIVGIMGKLVTDGLFEAFGRPANEQNELTAYQNQLNSRLPRLRAAIATEVSKLYAEIAQQVDTQIEYFFQQELEAALVTLRQAQNIHVEGTHRVNEVKLLCSETLSRIIQLRQELEDFAQSIWPNLLPLEPQ